MTKDEKQWWLEAADDDFRAFETLRKEGNLPPAAFHLQQSAEKRLKALCLDQGRPAFIHSCVELLRKIEAFGVQVPENIKHAARRLDPHYVIARYPNGIGCAPRDYYDAALLEELERCHKTLMNFVDSHVTKSSGLTP